MISRIVVAAVCLIGSSAYGFVDDPTAEPEEFVRLVFETLASHERSLTAVEYEFRYIFEDTRSVDLPDGTHIGSYTKVGEALIRRGGKKFFCENEVSRIDNATNALVKTRTRYIINDTLAAEWLIGSITAHVDEYQGFNNRDDSALNREQKARVGDPLQYGFDDPFISIHRIFSIIKNREDRHWRVTKSNQLDAPLWRLEIWGASPVQKASDIVRYSQICVDPSRDYLITSMKSYIPGTDTIVRAVDIELTWNEQAKRWLPSRVTDSHFDNNGITSKLESDINSIAFASTFPEKQFSLEALDMNEGVTVFRNSYDGYEYTDKVVNGTTENLRKKRENATQINQLHANLDSVHGVFDPKIDEPPPPLSKSKIIILLGGVCAVLLFFVFSMFHKQKNF